MAMYTVLSYNIFGKVFDFNQNLNARLGVLREIAIKVCMPCRCKSSYEEAVWLLSDSKKPFAKEIELSLLYLSDRKESNALFCPEL